MSDIPKTDLPPPMEEKKVDESQKKKVEFKKNLEEDKKSEDRKPIALSALKPILTIKVDETPDDDYSGKAASAVGMMMMSKKKTKNWLNVPVRQKPKPPLFPGNKEEEAVEEVEEISEDPVVLKGARVNLLGKINDLDFKKMHMILKHFI